MNPLAHALIDGQRLAVALSDPFNQGWDLLGTAFYEPDAASFAPGPLWTVQLVSVVGGHMLGAWAGHQAEAREEGGRVPWTRQVPLVGIMVGLTVLTLWSLGRSIVTEDAPAAATLVTTQRQE